MYKLASGWTKKKVLAQVAKFNNGKKFKRSYYYRRELTK